MLECKNTLFLVLVLVTLGALSSPGVQCVAHRGFSSAFQENTIASMMAAWEAGADVVELDVRVLADDEVVLFHDEEIANRIQHYRALGVDGIITDHPDIIRERMETKP